MGNDGTKSLIDFATPTHDALLVEIRKLLPIHTESNSDGESIFTGGDPGEVIVRVGTKRITISIFSLRWDGPHTPVIRPIRLASLNWRRLPAVQLTSILQNLVETAQTIRLSSYRLCTRCDKSIPPEWMHNSNTCQSCAERFLSVVH